MQSPASRLIYSLFFLSISTSSTGKMVDKPSEFRENIDCGNNVVKGKEYQNVWVKSCRVAA